MSQGSIKTILWAVVAILILTWLLGWYFIPDITAFYHILIVVAVIIIILNVWGLFGRGNRTTTTTTKD